MKISSNTLDLFYKRLITNKMTITGSASKGENVGGNRVHFLIKSSEGAK